MTTGLLLGAVAVATTACVLLGQVLRELRHLRERTARPLLVLDIEADAGGVPAVTVTNVGDGPALDAELTVAFDRHGPAPGATHRPPGLPQRFHVARVLAPGGQVRFPPPGDHETGHLAPEVLAAWVSAIHLTGRAKRLDGRPVAVADRLDDPFRRVEAIRVARTPTT